jgi:hypothetical protein
MPKMNIPVIFKPLVEVFQAIDGQGQLWSPSGQFLGLLSSNSNDPNSILNTQGSYGSPFSLKSIHNPQGVYGGSAGMYSPFNLNCLNPPIILYQRQPILVVTSNLNVFTNGLKSVDPYLMLTIYEELGNTSSKPVAMPSQSANKSQRPNPQVLKDMLALV